MIFFRIILESFFKIWLGLYQKFNFYNQLISLILLKICIDSIYLIKY